jgi:hypothetical protein
MNILKAHEIPPPSLFLEMFSFSTTKFHKFHSTSGFFHDDPKLLHCFRLLVQFSGNVELFTSFIYI